MSSKEPIRRIKKLKAEIREAERAIERIQSHITKTKAEIERLNNGGSGELRAGDSSRR